ncbi:hypothetical protein MPTK1_7g17890 [Marchantia polymorpha subsp. ruderalis]|uniref:Uncharacterized protein n=2 Tax=Marchantia polymorpha TaxID=3197 RepID=A0AAF6C0W9_MARPO|nr:hypothetical protein MARPO_0102s0051 [Marchantia polymorpha]BBN17903.1 hypothetical protein Mp_7g17890 [Marchantia polymorpha subsp. ruderalis]|eukprot:PTQ32187.1 hypothetical protein MARPO_0102s0051 [Marchantia polymorpha]
MKEGRKDVGLVTVLQSPSQRQRSKEEGVAESVPRVCLFASVTIDCDEDESTRSTTPVRDGPGNQRLLGQRGVGGCGQSGPGGAWPGWAEAVPPSPSPSPSPSQRDVGRTTRPRGRRKGGGWTDKRIARLRFQLRFLYGAPARGSRGKGLRPSEGQT